MKPTKVFFSLCSVYFLCLIGFILVDYAGRPSYVTYTYVWGFNKRFGFPLWVLVVFPPLLFYTISMVFKKEEKTVEQNPNKPLSEAPPSRKEPQPLGGKNNENRKTDNRIVPPGGKEQVGGDPTPPNEPCKNNNRTHPIAERPPIPAEGKVWEPQIYYGKDNGGKR